MKLRPLHDRILVRRIEEEEKTKGGLIIPDTAKEKPQEGKVIAVGKGRSNEDGKLLPLDVHKGDRVLFTKYAGNEIEVGSLSSYSKAREIAALLRDEVARGDFLLAEPIRRLPRNQSMKRLAVREKSS